MGARARTPQLQWRSLEKLKGWLVGSVGRRIKEGFPEEVAWEGVGEEEGISRSTGGLNEDLEAGQQALEPLEHRGTRPFLSATGDSWGLCSAGPGPRKM